MVICKAGPYCVPNRFYQPVDMPMVEQFALQRLGLMLMHLLDVWLWVCLFRTEQRLRMPYDMRLKEECKRLLGSFNPSPVIFVNLKIFQIKNQNQVNLQCSIKRQQQRLEWISFFLFLVFFNPKFFLKFCDKVI
jgi:hypothetical protein